MIDHLLVVDDALTPEQCDFIVNESLTRGVRDTELHTYLNYRHFDYGHRESYTHPILAPLGQSLLDQYYAKYPELYYIDQTIMYTGWRVKHFPVGHAFERWHCEHNKIIPHRILCTLVYLTDNPDAGTEFMHSGHRVVSRKGRAIVFPTFFTHVHRGQTSSQSRWIMSNYLFMGDQPSDNVRTNPPVTGPMLTDSIVNSYLKRNV
jgi:hypothetical protein